MEAPLRLCPPEPLQNFVQQVFQSLGAGEDIATEVALHLVRSNLSGHDSHGVIRVKQYVTQIDAGEVVPSARPTVARENSATALIDAHRGMGLYSTAFALDWAMARAAEHGLAAVAVRHSTHIGRLGEYTERAAQNGLLAILTVGAAGPGVGGMFLLGGRNRFMGANPWSIGIPPDVVYDGSTSTIAEGKVRVARAKQAQLPADCIIDAQGRVTTNPEDFYSGGAILPLGGKVAGHKGYGLALASALIGGLAMIDDSEFTLIGAEVHERFSDERGRVAGVFLVVVNPAGFGDAGHYRAMTTETLAAVKRMPRAEGVAEILIPGEPETRSREQRTREGIPIPEATWQDLAQVGQRFGLTLPQLGNS